MTDAEECADRFAALGMPEEVYAPLVALFLDPLRGAKVSTDASGALCVRLDIASVDAATAPIREWLAENGYDVPVQTEH